MDSSCWLIDTRFLTIGSGLSAILADIAIRDLRTGELLLQEHVDYEEANSREWKKAIRRAVEQQGERGTKSPPMTVVDRFVSKNYAGGRTYGSSIKRIKEKILDLGYTSATHHLLSYGTPLDVSLFERILRLEDALVVPVVRVERSERMWHVNVL